jgi:hypothetical protein
MSEGYILAAPDITAGVDMSAVEFTAVAEDTLAVAADTPVVATVVTGRAQSFEIGCRKTQPPIGLGQPLLQSL